MIKVLISDDFPTLERPDKAISGYPSAGYCSGRTALINTLINRKNYARTSSQPGKTQTLNFYKIEDELYFVDVPGYGYAKVSKKDREKWGKMIETYFETRQELRGVISLVDARHEPTELDCQMIEFLHYYNLPILVVGTKIDKIARGKWNKSESIIRKKLRLRKEDKVILFSAVTKTGKEQIWEWIDAHTMGAK